MNHKVLLLEDDADIGFIISYILEKAGCTVIKSRFSRCTSDIVLYKPHLILLNLFVGESFLTCEKLKSDPETSQLPLMLISSLNNLPSLAEKYKADDFLCKPFDIEVLEAKVLSVLMLSRGK